MSTTTETACIPSTETNQRPPDETLYLTGRPSLRQFLRFVRHHAIDPSSEASLSEEWHAARKRFHAIEKAEAGIADDPPILQMGPEYEPLLMEFLKDPLVQHGFNTVPTEVAIVELDRLVVYQKHIDLTYAQQLGQQFGPGLDRDHLFKTCLPYDHPKPPGKWSRMRRNSYVFVSPSNDLRFLGAMKMNQQNITGYPPPGNLLGVLGLAVGFGSNFMNAVYIKKRLILNNGSHRAYTLRRMGITHAPCIIQHVSSLDELDVVGASDIVDDPDLYLKHPRPSMLKDYFNPSLHKVMTVHRRLRQVTVRFEVEESFTPAL